MSSIHNWHISSAFNLKNIQNLLSWYPKVPIHTSLCEQLLSNKVLTLHSFRILYFSYQHYVFIYLSFIRSLSSNSTPLLATIGASSYLNFTTTLPFNSTSILLPLFYTTWLYSILHSLTTSYDHKHSHLMVQPHLSNSTYICIIASVSNSWHRTHLSQSSLNFKLLLLIHSSPSSHYLHWSWNWL